MACNASNIDLPADLPDLPTGWKYQPLGDLVHEERGICYGVVQPGSATEGGVPIVRVNNIRNGNIDIQDALRIAADVEAIYVRSRLRGGEVLLTLVGSLGESAIVPESLACWNVARAVGVIPVRRDIGPRWIHLCLRSPLTQHYIRIWATTTVQATFNLRDVARLPITLPPDREREAIALVLGALDDKIELNRRMNETLEAIAQALFKSWFVDFDPVHAKAAGRKLAPQLDALFPSSFEASSFGEIPKGWRVMKFGDFIRRLPVGQKYDQKSVSTVGAVPVLDQGKSGVIGFHNDAPGVVATLDKPVVVFANHTCYMRLIPYSFSAIQNVLPFVGLEVDTLWSYYATRDRLSFSEYKGHWPDFIIQEAVVPNREATEMFGERVKALFTRIFGNEEQSRTLAELRDTLLPKLLSGEVRVREAEKILERIPYEGF